MVSSLRLDVDARRRKVDEILATVRCSVAWFTSGFLHMGIFPFKGGWLPKDMKKNC